jgi:hypothetical protein
MLIQRRPLSLLETVLAGTRRVAIDRARRELAPAPALDGLVKPEDHRARRHKGFDQQVEQHSGDLSCRPADPIQQPMIVLKAGLAG